MNKIIKRFLKIVPGGRKFIKNYKNLVAENYDLKNQMNSNGLHDANFKDCQIKSEEAIVAEDYKVYFFRT